MRVLFILLAFLFCTPAFAGTIIVDLSERTLTYNGKSYPVAVPRPGVRKPIGTYVIQRMVEWPSWMPTANMRRRDPSLRAMRGGPRNPLGARALYLYRGGVETMYRIHGTNDDSSIGKAASSGCIRMYNEHVIALFSSVPMGMKVVIRA